MKIQLHDHPELETRLGLIPEYVIDSNPVLIADGCGNVSEVPSNGSIDNARVHARLIVHYRNKFMRALESLKACYAHAEDMTCQLDKTDDTSDYPYLERARRVIAELEEVGE